MLTGLFLLIVLTFEPLDWFERVLDKIRLWKYVLGGLGFTSAGLLIRNDSKDSISADSLSAEDAFLVLEVELAKLKVS